MELDERFLLLVLFLDVGDNLIDAGLVLQTVEVVVIVIAVIVVVIVKIRLGAVFQAGGGLALDGQLGADDTARTEGLEVGRKRVGMGRVDFLAAMENKLDVMSKENEGVRKIEVIDRKSEKKKDENVQSLKKTSRT